MRDNLFVPNKMAYIKGKAKPDVECILCAIVEGDARVERLDIYRAELFTISLNLYPYSPGHLMIFPNRHIVDVREFTREEVVELHRLQCRSLEVWIAYTNPTDTTSDSMSVKRQAQAFRMYTPTLSRATPVN